MIVQVVLGGLVAAFLVLLLVGGLTRRVRLTGCCATSDPAKDLRMRGPDDSVDSADSTGAADSQDRSPAGGSG